MSGSCNHLEKTEAKCVLSSYMLYAYIQHSKSDTPREVLHTLHICIQLRGEEELESTSLPAELGIFHGAWYTAGRDNLL